ncbi:uncharacterized protein LOC127079242 [Lathyrus oleraceus]|uniref:uncharacterized protein LOC127079242 n=1 Tax=Pisum sativum TaxID=3888 RepID=UPI0021D26EA3|nr:uncharacterized protein LOC127079242 [Pisum sativum]
MITSVDTFFVLEKWFTLSTMLDWLRKRNQCFNSSFSRYELKNNNELWKKAKTHRFRHDGENRHLGLRCLDLLLKALLIHEACYIMLKSMVFMFLLVDLIQCLI